MIHQTGFVTITLTTTLNEGLSSAGLSFKSPVDPEPLIRILPDDGFKNPVKELGVGFDIVLEIPVRINSRGSRRKLRLMRGVVATGKVDNYGPRTAFEYIAITWAG